MVARALLLQPRLIIADEPVSMIDASLRATILGSLRQLNAEFGISIIYITHDLTTAYQISDNIIVLYRGSVAEAGDVRLVVRKPQHPYTRLLVGSIPLPDLQRSSGRRRRRRAVGREDRTDPRCKFVDRCPSAPRCTHSGAAACTVPTIIGRRRASFTRGRPRSIRTRWTRSLRRRTRPVREPAQPDDRMALGNWSVAGSPSR